MKGGRFIYKRGCVTDYIELTVWQLGKIKSLPLMTDHDAGHWPWVNLQRLKQHPETQVLLSQDLWSRNCKAARQKHKPREKIKKNKKTHVNCFIRHILQFCPAILEIHSLLSDKSQVDTFFFFFFKHEQALSDGSISHTPVKCKPPRHAVLCIPGLGPA